VPRQLNLGYHDIDIRAVSGFGQVMWQVLPQLELAAGARWTKEERDHEQINTITGMPVRTPLVNDELDSDNVSPEVTVTYTPTDDLTLFASYKQAFKSGSFDSVTIKPAGSDLSFADEEVRGYEGGIKTRLFGRALTLNLAAYSYHYRDLQVGTNEISETGAIAIRTVNAATANIYGVDFDTTYKAPALAPLTLSAGVSYNHARYGSFDNAPCYGGQTIAMGCNRILNPVTGRFTAQDLSGRELMRA
jgi:iron complex outermembrane receptor protein